MAVTGGSLNATVPPQSITLFVIPALAGNQPPVAAASASPASGLAPLAVSFSGSSSSDPDGTIVSYAWNFGDGGSGSGASTSHTYSSAGTFTATLTVTDNAGATGSSSVTITVTTDTLNAPSSLSGSASGGTATLRWTDNSNNEQGFYIERALKARGTSTFSRVGQVGAGTTTFSENVAAAAYLYRVQAFNATKVSAYSNQVQVRVR